MRRWIFSIFALLVLCGSALAQGGAVKNTSPTGAAIGSGYNLTNGVLYIPSSGSMTAMKMPFSVSFDMLANNTSWTNGLGNYFMYGGGPLTSVTTGFYLSINATAGRPDSTAAFQVAILPSGTASCDAPGSAGKVCWRGLQGTLGPLVDNVRHHICTVWTSTRASLYVDGVLRDQATSVGTFTAGTNVWRIGNNFQQGVGAAPTIYDMRVYSKALTADECVQINVLQKRNLIPNSGTINADLILSLPLNNCDLSAPPLANCPDGSGNSNNATNDKAPPVVTITAPTTGTKTGTITVQSTCVDPAGLLCTKVCYMIDGGAFSLVCPTTAPFTYSLDTTKIVDGVHSITGVGFNFTGVTGTSAGVSITTSNSVAATNYYFDSVAGLDSNNCTSTGTACQTIAHLATLALKGGDTVNFLHDDTFPITAAGLTLCAGNSGCASQNYFPSNGTLTFTTYGGGSCNPISGSVTGCASLSAVGGTTAVSGIRGFNAPNVSINNLAFIGNVASLTARCTANGVEFDNSFPSNFMTGPTINNNFIKDFGCEISMNNFNTANAGPISNYSITDNFLTNTTHVVNGRTFPTNPSAIDGIDIRANVNGTIQGNLITYMGGHTGDNGNGIAIHNYPNILNETTLIQSNVVHDFGANCMSLGGGPVGFYTSSASNITMQFNEVYNGLPASFPVLTGIDYDGFDIDDGSTHVLEQYNYAHDNPVQGGFNTINFPLGTFTWSLNTIRYNIAENNGSGITGAGPAFDTTSYIYNNTFVSNGLANPNQALCWGGSGTTQMIANIVNNLCISTVATAPSVGTEANYFGDVTVYVNSGFGTAIATPAMVMLTNAYWSAGAYKGNQWHTTQRDAAHSNNFCCAVANTTLAAQQITWPTLDVGSIYPADAMVVGPIGNDLTCYVSGIPAGPQPCPAGYALQHGSPLIGIGTDLTQAPYSLSIGTRDYFGNSIAGGNGVGTGYNIGAYGAAP